MANKRHSEDGDGTELEGQAKGKKGSPASFKDFKSPDGTGDDENFGGFGDVKSGNKHPKDEQKHLPKSGGKLV